MQQQRVYLYLLLFLRLQRLEFFIYPSRYPYHLARAVLYPYLYLK
jgi:hypothetical protein